MNEPEAHFRHSALRERVVEHVFVGSVLQALWRRGVTDVEVLRSEFDAHGYDIVLVRGAVMRHIQLKTGVQPRPGRISVSEALAAKPSGCLLWIGVTQELELSSYWWFGGAPGQPLPTLDGYPNPLRIRPGLDGVRPPRTGHRSLPTSAFEQLVGMDGVLERLFGSVERSVPPVVAEIDNGDEEG